MPNDFKLPNFSTTVDAQKSSEEVSRLLINFGATGIYTEYEEQQPAALQFKIKHDDREIAFRLPVDTPRLHQLLMQMHYRGHVPASKATKEHARRVGWRIIKDWVRAQLGLLATEMVQPEELLLPWAVLRSGETVAEHMLDENKGLRMLTSGHDLPD